MAELFDMSHVAAQTMLLEKRNEWQCVQMSLVYDGRDVEKKNQQSVGQRKFFDIFVFIFFVVILVLVLVLVLVLLVVLVLVLVLLLLLLLHVVVVVGRRAKSVCQVHIQNDEHDYAGVDRELQTKR